ncbi:hypothetical protein QUA44_09040 [Microcoleus sp. N9_A2]
MTASSSSLCGWVHNQTQGWRLLVAVLVKPTLLYSVKWDCRAAY